MKKYILTSLTLLCLSPLFSQTVNGKKFSDIKEKYIEIVGWNKAFSAKMDISLYFGHLDNDREKNKRIKDKDGNPVELNSMLEALNFMDSVGFEYVDSYKTGEESATTYYHYILRRKE